MSDASNADQREFWSDIAGPKWIAHQQSMDALMKPVLDGVLSRAAPAPGDRVLDIGCGTGASSLRASDLVGSQGHVLGADISDPLLALARKRAQARSNLAFVHTDAATHPFEPAQFDHLISRFGVMFFNDPVAAFANMAQALKPGARVTLAAWGQIPNNPFFTLPAQAARSVLGAMPKPDPDAPGPFAFRDPARVFDILAQAGLRDPGVDTVALALTPEGTIEAFAQRCCDIGPAEAAIQHFDASAAQRQEIVLGLAEAFAPFQADGGLHIPAEINFFHATA